MNFIESVNKSSPLEIILFIIFVLYIVFPFETPPSIAYMVDSPLGMISIFCVTVYLFFYTNPLLGILYIFVAYELLRRSSNVTGRTAIIEYTPSQAKKDAELKKMNPPVGKTLEEEIIDIRAPVGKSSSVEIVNSDFKPVADRIVSGASLI
jgi:hypothetical protein